MTRYPQIKVSLIGKDSNAFGIMGAVKKAMRENNIPEDEVKAYLQEAVTGDYHHLLRVSMKWISVI